MEIWLAFSWKYLANLQGTLKEFLKTNHYNLKLLLKKLMNNKFITVTTRIFDTFQILFIDFILNSLGFYIKCLIVLRYSTMDNSRKYSEKHFL